MVNNNTKRTFYYHIRQFDYHIRHSNMTQTFESKSPVKITGLSSHPNGNLSFYNSNTGSRDVDATVDFKYDISECITINEIINTCQKGTFDVCGTIKWLQDNKICSCWTEQS